MNSEDESVNIVSQLNNAIQLLNVTDDYIDTLVGKLSDYDKKTSDLLHYIENNNLNAPQSCKIVKEIKKIRQKRREVKKSMEISKIYKDNINKLINKESRNMLLAKIHKSEKRLETDYKNRIYTEEDLSDILGGKQ